MQFPRANVEDVEVERVGCEALIETGPGMGCSELVYAAIVTIHVRPGERAGGFRVEGPVVALAAEFQTVPMQVWTIAPP